MPPNPFAPLARLHGSWKRFTSSSPLLKTAGTIFFWLPTGVVFVKYGFTVRAVTGGSMQPTLNPDLSQPRDVVLFDRFSVGTRRQYQRGDIVAFWSPHEVNKLLVKRLIALPGDKVKTLPPYPDKEVVIPTGHAWLEGDASFNSEDSNHFGPVPLALLDSKMVHIIYPFGRNPPVRPSSMSSRQEMEDLERRRRYRSRVTTFHA